MYLGRNKLNLWAEEELDPNIVSYAAAVSIILGSKLHESKGELTLVRRTNPLRISFQILLLKYPDDINSLIYLFFHKIYFDTKITYRILSSYSGYHYYYSYSSFLLILILILIHLDIPD